MKESKCEDNTIQVRRILQIVINNNKLTNIKNKLKLLI
jgi:hypothetical protein